MATTKAEEATFSYTVVRSLKRHPNTPFRWTAIDKGYDKSKKYEISYRTIKHAASLIRSHIIKTPCYKSKILSENGYKIYLKNECYQFTDSIQARGVIYTLLQLSDEHKRKGVIAISAGNFAFILCHYGYKFHIPVIVVLPKSVAHKKVKLCKQYSHLGDISVLVDGRNMLEAHKIALGIAKTKGLFYLDENNHPNMIIGQATLGLEIMLQQPKIDTVLLPTTIDGCGLTAGIATVIKGFNSKIKVIEIQCKDFLFQDVIQQTDLINELEIPAKEYVVCPIRDISYIIDRSFHINRLTVSCAFNELYENYGYRDHYGGIVYAPILYKLLCELKRKRVVIPFFGRMDSEWILRSKKKNLKKLICETYVKLVNFSPLQRFKRHSKKNTDKTES